MDLLNEVRESFDQYSPEGIEVGLSGGLDSVVLLHLLGRLRRQKSFALAAVHVHHGLSRYADEWADFCRDYCRKLDIPLRAVSVRIEKNGLGTEAAARALRYQAFSDGLYPTMALAHHQDDQVETFMLAAARGGGIRSLAAMPQWRKLEGGKTIWRPLLSISREALADYASQHGLAYVEDDSNRDTLYLRNWFRHQLLPQWRAHSPDIDRHILANIRSLQRDLQLLDEVVRQDFEYVCREGFFSLALWRDLSETRRSHVLRQFLLTENIAMPPHAYLREMSRVLFDSGKGTWELGEQTLCAYRNRLFIYKQNKCQQWPWQNGTVVRGRLKDILQANGFVLKPHPFGLSESALMQQGSIRYFGDNDAVKWVCGDKSVKKVLQESHILPLVRKKWPIITNADGVCLAVANLKAHKDFADAAGLLPVFEPFQQYIAELNPSTDV